MHQIAFDLKRAYLRTKRWGELAMGIPGMTQARFDLMFLIREKQLLGCFDENGVLGPLEVGVSQLMLQKRVDVSKQTTSIMLKRLERIGWVRRERGKGRRRRENIVFLTATGLQRIAKAMRVLFRQRRLLAYFERIYTTDARHRFQHVLRSLFDTSECIQFIGNAFGDRSAMQYDYGATLAMGGKWGYEDHDKPKPFDPLYEPPPPPKLPPKPLVGAARGPVRPIGFTEYETRMRAYFWGDEKKLPKKKKPPFAPPADSRRAAVFLPITEEEWPTRFSQGWRYGTPGHPRRRPLIEEPVMPASGGTDDAGPQRTFVC